MPAKTHDPALVRDNGILEVIVPDPGTVLRWHCHGYPDLLARWHHHPEVEFHLIREGTGQMMIGDALVPFEAGQVTLIGGGVPHNWLSDLGVGESLGHRDVLCQVRPERLTALAEIFAEAAPVRVLLERSSHGIALEGEPASRAAGVLDAMGTHTGVGRLADLLALIAVFCEAPDSQWHSLVTPGYQPDLTPDTAHRINTALAVISQNLSTVNLADVADSVAMSPGAFSRFFHQASGITFSDLVRRLRISRACHLLTSTDLPISRIQEDCGYRNPSNFNRRFREETGTTPREYRRDHRR